MVNIKYTDAVKEVFIEVLTKVYEQSDEAHLACMMKQFMIYEPVSLVLFNIFTEIRLHYEKIVKTFIEERNNYIEKNKTSDRLNDWAKLIDKWENTDTNNDLDSSSVILLFLNPPKKYKSGIRYEVKAVPNTLKLKAAVKKFHFKGFCPKVPHERVAALLEFPLNEFIVAICELNPEYKPLDYKKIEEELRNILKEKPTKPTDKITPVERKKIPEDLLKRANIQNKKNPNEEETKARFALVKWYTIEILELRRALLPSGRILEDYYVELAKFLNVVHQRLKSMLLVE
jgi:hypothetical protein